MYWDAAGQNAAQLRYGSVTRGWIFSHGLPMRENISLLVYANENDATGGLPPVQDRIQIRSVFFYNDTNYMSILLGNPTKVFP